MGQPHSSLADGRHPARITAVDPSGEQVTIDVVQFFYGEAATEAARADGSTNLPPPNNHWFRNVNPRLRTLPIAPDAEVWVNGQSSGETYSHAISLSKLASYGDIRGALFWVTTRDGAVTGICQYWMSPGTRGRRPVLRTRPGSAIAASQPLARPQPRV